MKRLLIGFVAAGVVTAWGTGVARAAAPRIVIVSGQPLAHQVVISNWHSIFVVVQEAANGRPALRAQHADRPRLKLSMFWGPRWNDYLSNGKYRRRFNTDPLTPVES